MCKGGVSESLPVVPTRATLPAPPISPEAIELGALLKRARGDRTLRQIQERCGRRADGKALVSRVTLSLLENGKRAVSPALLELIVAAVGADNAEAFRLAGLLPPQAAAEVLGPEVGHVLVRGGLSTEARLALRRVHLSEIASRFTREIDQAPVAVDTLLFEKLGIDIETSETVGWARFASAETIEYHPRHDADDLRGERNLMLAHMTAHALVAREAGRHPHCSHEAGGRPEAEATWLGGLILTPRALLESEFQGRKHGYPLDTAGGLSDLIRDIAGAFGVPFWLAMRHVADAGLLAWAYGMEDL